MPPVSSRAEIRKAVVRYGLYVNSRKWIDGIFNELDKDGSAARSEHRLLAVMSSGRAPCGSGLLETPSLDYYSAPMHSPQVLEPAALTKSRRSYRL